MTNQCSGNLAKAGGTVKALLSISVGVWIAGVTFETHPQKILDEADAGRGRINGLSPLAWALMKVPTETR